MKKTLIATALAASFAMAGTALAADTHQHDTPAPQKKAAPAKPAAKGPQHDHDACPMMQGRMMGQGGMGMRGGAASHDPAAHAAMEKRLGELNPSPGKAGPPVVPMKDLDKRPALKKPV